MYTIRLVVRCSGEYAEVLPEEMEIVECVIEEQFCLLLLQLLGASVIVDVMDVEYVLPQDQSLDVFPPAA